MIKKYRMSSAQKRIYSINNSLGPNIIYNIPNIMRIDGVIDVNKLENALNKLCDRHEILRTYFKIEKENFLQVVKDKINVKLQVETDIKKRSQDIINAFIRPYDLTKPPLFRCKLVQFNSRESILIFDIHHIICDGGSIGILFNDLSNLYNDIELDSLYVHYKNFSAWQNKKDLKEQELFWLNKKLNDVPRLELITDFARKGELSYIGDTKCFTIEEKYIEDIKKFTKKYKITEYMFFLSVFLILLSKYSKQNEFIIGTPIAGRIHPDTQDMIGMFVNTLPIIAHIKDSDNFVSFIKEVKEYCIGAFENQELQFEELVEKVGITRELSRNPLFDVMFTFNNQNISDIKMGEAILNPLKIVGKTAKFDLTLTVEASEDSYEMLWEYSTELFKEETILRIGQHFNNLVINILNNIDKPINEINVLNRDEEKLILESFNDCNNEFCIDKSIIDLFEEQVNKTPNNIAIEDHNNKLTYKQLDEKSNIITKFLSENCKKHNGFIGVTGENKIEMIISIIGIVKSGRPYMPIDIKYPEKRIKFMVTDCKCEVILDCKSDITKKLECVDVKIVNIRDLILDDKICPNFKIKYEQNDIAYLMYTSGTTGNPKGVVVGYKSILRLVKDTNYIDFNKVNILQTGSLAFDASTFEIWGALLNGGRLFLVSEEVLLNPEMLKKCLIKNKIDTMFITTALFNQLIDMDEEIFDSLDQLLFGGEAASQRHVCKLVERNSINRLLNIYGPTENTTFSLFYPLTKETLREEIPIGKPISNTKAYIYNGKSLCGIGMQGELCLAGLGLAKGYLNNPEMTSEKFVENPNKKGEIIYRTGDLVKWLEDGNIHYLGRIDSQVKIRGYRIELNEIENELKKIDGIRDAVVVVRVINNNKAICAYYLSDKETLNLDIKDKLRASLPEYMIPMYILRLDKFPITKNGKYDKEQFPINRFNIENSIYQKPRNLLENNIASVFSEVLGIEKIGINDNFFELGGDSIKSIRIVSKLREMGYKISVKTIMKYRTIKNISPKVEFEEITYSDESVIGKVKLTPIQIEFINNRLSKPNHFNQSILLTSEEKLNIDNLQKAVNAIVNHHDILRAIFDIEKGEQNIAPVGHNIPQITYIDMRSENDFYIEMNKQILNIQESFDLRRGPLFKVAVFTTLDKDYIFLCAHHLIIDGVSWRIITEDINKAFMQIKNNEEIKLPIKTTSFQKWSDILQNYRCSEQISTEIDYWREIEQQVTKSKMSLNTNREANVKKILSVSLEKEKTNELLYESVRAYNLEINDILLTALSRTINSIFGEEEICINLEGHGREEIQSNISVDRTVGWFTSIYPVVFNSIGQCIKTDLRTVKNTLRKIPNYGVGYGIIKNLGENVLKGVEAPVTFNYLGEFGQEVQSGDLVLSTNSFGNDIAEENNFGCSTLDVNGGINNKELVMNITFCSKYYDEDVMNEFCANFKNQLIEIIEHCKEVYSVEYTSSDFGEYGWTDDEFTKVYNRFLDSGVRLKKIYPLTPLQEGMLYHKMMDKDSTNYVVQNIFEINEEIDIEALKNSIDMVSKKHEVLRTNIIYENVSVPRQVILEDKVLDISSHDYSYMSLNEALECFERLKNKEISKGFDLENDNLIRTNIVKVNKNLYYMILTFHHIILDGWCISIIVNDILSFYNLLVGGRAKEDIAIESVETYETYVRYIKKKRQSEGLEYWKKLLDEYDSEINILSLGKDTKYKESNKEVEVVSTQLDKNINDKLKEVSKMYNVTYNTIIEVAWALILRQYTNKDDIVFGKVVSGRNRDIEGIENTVGLFINTVPVRVKYSQDTILSDLLKEVQEQAMQTTEYDYCSLAQIQEQSRLGNSLFNTLFAFENYYVQERHEKNGITLVPKGGREQTNYPINLSVYLNETLNMNLMYDTNKYNDSQMYYLLEQLKIVLKEIGNKSNKSIENIETISKNQIEKIIHVFNKTESYGYANKTIIELFEEQVEKNFDKIALEYGEEKLTYEELNDQADTISNYLSKFSTKRNSFIGVIGDNKLQMVTAIVGILKSGNAYMPIDSKYPEERINYIVKDSNCKIIIDCSSKEQNIIDFHDIEVCTLKSILLNDDNKLCLDKCVNRVEDPVYLIYTSGTTGQPKGVVVNNENVIRLVKETNYVDLNKTNILQTGSLAFDASTFEIWGALLNGGKLCLVSNNVLLNPEVLKPIIINSKINTMFITTALFNHLLDMDESIFDSVDQLLFGGEVTSEKHVRKLINRNLKQKFMNVYGPTENTTFSLFYVINKETLRQKTPIGKPISNTQAYVINGNRLCGIGMPGELCLGGKGVAKGYLNKRVMTEEKFIKNPYKKDDRIYRTGDLVRWLQNGDIEYLGRIDDQVKIRGYRIELGEIENKLRELNEVMDSVVQVIQKDENKYLYAYIISNIKVDINHIKDTIRSALPEYMIPNEIIQLKEFPKNRSGKVDKKLLPIPKITNTKQFEKPTNKIEIELIKLFEEILGIQDVGINNDFFDIGGNSLKSIRLITKMKKLGYKLSINELLSLRTIKNISLKIVENNNCSIFEYKDIVRSLKERLGIEIKFTTQVFGTKIYIIMFVENLNNEIKDRIKNIIANDFDIRFLPHYFIDLSEYSLIIDEDIKLGGKNKDSYIYKDNMFEKYMEILERSSFMPTSRIIKSYECTNLQNSFISINSCIVDNIVVNNILNESILIKIIESIIDSQSVLRSSYHIDEKGKYIIDEHEKGNDILYLDFTKVSYFQETQLNEKIEEVMNQLIKEKQLLSKFLIIRLNEKDFKIVFSVHHCIWDKSSSRVLENILNSMINNEGTNKNHILEYKKYIDSLLKRGSIQYDKSLFNKELYKDTVNEYLINNCKNKLDRSEILIISMNEKLQKKYEEEPWNLILYIVKLIAIENKLQVSENKLLPIFSVQQDRMNKCINFQNTLGLFLDTLPILIDCCEDIEYLDKNLQLVYKLKEETGINYNELICNNNFSLKGILSINFLDIFQLSSDEIQQIKDYSRSMATTEILIIKQSDKLIVRIPIYEGAEKNIKDNITNKLLKI